MIDLMLKTGINQYMEFKSVDGSFMSGAAGKLESVPDSRSAIFKNRSLSLTEKNQLMKFFKLVQGHLGNGSEDEKLSDQDLETPFLEFLTKMGLSQKLKSYISFLTVLYFLYVSENAFRDCYILLHHLESITFNYLFIDMSNVGSRLLLSMSQNSSGW